MSWHCVGPGCGAVGSPAAAARPSAATMAGSASRKRGAVGGGRRSPVPPRLHDAVEHRPRELRPRSRTGRCLSMTAMNPPLRARLGDLPRARGDVLRRLAVRRRGHQVVEDPRRAHDRGLLGMRQRHLDDLDAEQRRVGILRRRRRARSPAAPRRAHAATSPRCRRRRSPCPSGSTSTVCVCEPRQVCTLPTYFGLAMSVMSKMRMPRSRSALTVSVTPSLPQSRRPPSPSPETKSRFLYTDTSLCDAGQT